MPSQKGRTPKAPEGRRARKTGETRASKPKKPRTVGASDDLEAGAIPPVLFAPAPIDDPTWSPDSPGVWVERNATTGQVLSLSHPGLPYLAGDASSVTDDELLLIATGYLRAANDVLGVPDVWLDALAGEPGNLFVFPQWTRFGDDPRNSFRVKRTNEDGDVIDETALVIAVLCVGGQPPFPLYGGQGLRVTMHIDHLPADEPRNVRVTGVTSSLPPWNDEQLATASTATGEALKNMGLLIGGALRPFDPFLHVLGTIIVRKAGLPAGTDVTDYRFRYAVGGDLIPCDLLVKTVADPSSGEGLSYEIRVTFPPGATLEDIEVGPPAALVTFATAPAEVFVQDPVTTGGIATFRQTRPNHGPGSLDGSRTNTQLPDVQATGNANQFLLTDGSYVDIVGSFLDVSSIPGGTYLYDAGAAYASRTNTQSAVNAYFHFRGLILRLAGYGFSLPGYFKFAHAPLTVKYRGGIVPGSRDGKTINAQVRWQIRPSAPTAAGVGTLDTSLAMADLSMNRRKAPLGIACDPRWLWHEFGHVLLAAATGSLELPFAHSIGDAMSAIVHDPDSALRSLPKWRGITFPWVSIPGRRHDREAKDGWSWSGTFNGHERDFFAPGVSDRRGYWTEQMMSSSLFRMYRALGGDACWINGAGQIVPYPPARAIAADHALFLIMHATQLLGSSTSTSAQTPENFVTAITAADIGISALAPPTAYAGFPPRLGGFANKVARWAFEMQGAYPNSSMRFPNNGPGTPPDVDIYIDSGVPMSRRGGYRPVQFVNDDWHTRPSELWVQNAAVGFGVDQPPLRNKDNFVFVRVRNRGALNAAAASVIVYAAKIPGTGIIPDWPGAVWKTLPVATSGVAVADVPKSPGATTFGAFVWRPTPGTWALFAAATCAADKANTDPSTGWASAVSPPPQGLALRVACDNNLGVRRIVVP